MFINLLSKNYFNSTNFIIFYHSHFELSFINFRTFPPFDLLRVLESNTAVLKRLNQYEALYEAFVDKYNFIFENYLKQKLYNEMYKT